MAICTPFFPSRTALHTAGIMISSTACAARCSRSSRLSPPGNFSSRLVIIANVPSAYCCARDLDLSGFVVHGLPSAIPKYCSRSSGEVVRGGGGIWVWPDCKASAVVCARFRVEVKMAAKGVSAREMPSAFACYGGVKLKRCASEVVLTFIPVVLFSHNNGQNLEVDLRTMVRKRSIFPSSPD